jgi:hypothetical protein
LSRFIFGGVGIGIDGTAVVAVPGSPNLWNAMGYPVPRFLVCELYGPKISGAPSLDGFRLSGEAVCMVLVLVRSTRTSSIVRVPGRRREVDQIWCRHDVVRDPKSVPCHLGLRDTRVR